MSPGPLVSQQAGRSARLTSQRLHGACLRPYPVLLGAPPSVFDLMHALHDGVADERGGRQPDDGGGFPNAVPAT